MQTTVGLLLAFKKSTGTNIYSFASGPLLETIPSEEGVMSEIRLQPHSCMHRLNSS